ADDQPRVDNLLEGNVQVRQAFGERSFVYADISAFGRIAFDYRGVDESGNEIRLPDRDLDGSRPYFSLSELYLSHDFLPALNLTVGRKRVVWGSGMAYNPTDLLNPLKDPTDPALQRAGAWLAQLEVPLEKMTFSFLASPRITAQASGIPYRFLVWPEWDRRDDQAHYQLAARMYALVADADVNVMLFYGNGYRDEFKAKPRAGLSFSRYFFEVHELHVEALLQTGSPRAYVNGPCVASREAIIQCGLEKQPFTRMDLLESSKFLPRVLVGGRTHFSDESILSIEYLYQADGFTRAQAQDTVNALSQLRSLSTLLGSQGGAAGVPLFGADENGIPQRLRFEPMGQHYLFASWQKPNLRDDFTVSAMVLASLQDLSGLAVPSVGWRATEWMTLTASAFVPFPGPSSLAAVDPDTGEAVSEYSLVPMAWRGMFEIKVFY
ncbi:MAG: hypothetical protein WBV82_04570, partial [Myxococcaceae bacterium]